MEGINLLGSGKSFRTSKNKELIRFGENKTSIEAKVIHKTLDNFIRLDIFEKGKKIYLNDKLARSTASLLQLEPSITFSPADHNIPEGEAADRRSFLNKALAILDWEYIEIYQQFTKVLTQRNALIKKASTEESPLSTLVDSLEPWDAQFIHTSCELFWIRKQFIHNLNKVAEVEYQRISQSKDVFHNIYQPGCGQLICWQSIKDKEELNEVFTSALKDSLRRDYFSGSTRIGPQRDEILLTLNGNEVKFYSSQGEKRTCALALRLGELALFRERFQKNPVLLFDDVSSELDSYRRRALVDLLRKEDTQVFITSTELPSALIQETEKKFEHIELPALGESH